MPTPRLTCLTAFLATTALSGCTMGHDASQASAPATAPAANGSATPSASSSTEAATAKDVWAKAQKKVHDATSLSLEGTDAVDGSGPRGSYTGERDGEPGETTYKGREIGAFTMRHIGTDVYLKGDETYWKALEKHDPSTTGASVAANRWIKMPDSTLSKSDRADLAVKPYLDALGDSNNAKWGKIGESGTLTSETLSGKPAYKIVSGDGDTSVWVSGDGAYTLLQIVDEAAGTDEMGHATFSRWNEKITISRPAGAIDGGAGKRSSSAPATT